MLENPLGDAKNFNGLDALTRYRIIGCKMPQEPPALGALPFPADHAPPDAAAAERFHNGPLIRIQPHAPHIAACCSPFMPHEYLRGGDASSLKGNGGGLMP